MGAEQFSDRAFDYANHLQQQRRAQADASGDFSEADAPGHAQIVLFYSKLKKECEFKLVTDLDDLQWDLSPVIASYAKNIPNHDQMMMASLKQVLPVFDVVVCSTRYLASRIKSDLGVNAVVMPNGVSKSLFGLG